MKCLGGFLNKVRVADFADKDGAHMNNLSSSSQIGDNMNERIKVYARVHNELDKHSEELIRVGPHVTMQALFIGAEFDVVGIKRSQVLETKKVDLLEKGKEFPMR